MQKSILFVDDEEAILRSLRRSFFDSGYQCFFAQNAGQAMEILEKQKIDVIVADMRMPEVDGYQLLCDVKNGYPDTIRIILSGYTDRAVILKSIINGVAKAYFTKPWDDEQLKSGINHFLEIKNILTVKKVSSIISQIEKLPVLSEHYKNIIAAIEAGEDISSITKIIEKEPVYTSNILRVVNSSYYSTSISSLKQAVAFLGNINLKNIILLSTMQNFIENKNIEIYSSRMFFDHSVLCNYFAGKLHNVLYSRRIPNEYASAGLLHDIGISVMAHYFADTAEKVLKDLSGEEDLQTLENRILGLSHSELGAYLIDWWNLPMNLVEVCLFHHTPLSPKVLNREIMLIIYLADILSWRYCNQFQKLIIDPEVLKGFGIDENFLENELETYKKQGK